MESWNASFASRDLACRIGGACGVRAGFGAAGADLSSSLSLRAATCAARASGKFRTRALCLRAGCTGVRGARNRYAAEQLAREQLASGRLEPKQREPKQ